MLFLSKIFQNVAQIDEATTTTTTATSTAGTNWRLLSLKLTSFMLIMTHVAVWLAHSLTYTHTLALPLTLYCRAYFMKPTRRRSQQYLLCLPRSRFESLVLFSIWRSCLHKNSLHLVFLTAPTHP